MNRETRRSTELASAPRSYRSFPQCRVRALRLEADLGQRTHNAVAEVSMGIARRHIFLSAAALIVGLLVVLWLRPTTHGGTTFIMTISFILFNALGCIPWRALARRTARRHNVMILAIAGLGSAVISCGTQPAPEPNSAIIFHGGTTFRGSATRSDMFTPVRIFVKGSDIPRVGAVYGGYGVVAFAQGATPSSRRRLIAICQSFLSSLPSVSQVPASIPAADQIATMWPVLQPQSIESQTGDCGFLVDNYDVFGGQSAIRDARQQGRSLEGRGPFLIGWAPSSTRGVKDAVVLVIDLSPYDRQDEFDEMFLFWNVKVVADPSLWRHGFVLEQVRLVARDFVDSYGSDMLKAIDIWVK
jgi:hypothetical protein